MALRNLSPDRQSGTWTPTLTGVVNIDSITLLNAFFAIHGDVVQCWVAMTVDATAGSSHQGRISLPFGIDVAAVGDIIGMASSILQGGSGSITGDPTSNEAVVDGQNNGTGPESVVAQFAYRMT